MKFFVSFLAITLFIIDGIQNTPVIHPIHVHTVPLHPVTARPTSMKVTTRQSSVSPITTIHSSQHPWWYSSTSTRHMNITSSSSSSSTTTHHSSWFPVKKSSGQIFVRIFLYTMLITGVCKMFTIICKTKKHQKTNKKNNSLVVSNKMYVSTIDSKREESPPSYAEIHNV